MAAAGLMGVVVGAIGGATIASALDAAWWLGVGIGGAVLGGASAWADATRRPGGMQPLWVRVVWSGFLAAIGGQLLELALPDWSAVVPCVLVGLAAGSIGFRVGKLALGVGIGLLVGLAFDALWPDVGWAVPSATTVVVYRLGAAVAWRGRDQIRIVGEGIPEALAPYVVPLSEATAYVGIDYLERYAAATGAAFVHDPPDVGIVDDFDALESSIFDPSRIHPLVREFYEHTSRFTLAITPEWRWWMRLPYRLFRTSIAVPIGQANAPFDQEQVQAGVVSWIDTIDVDGDGRADFRAWIRAYATGEPIYIGIYTIQRIDDVAHVAVGFPVPSGSFTATLYPTNHRGDGLLLRSHGGTPVSGHYLSAIEDGELTTLELTTFDEEIDVFVDDGVFRTEHRFMLNGRVFMTLHYRITRKT